ncbi:hypothetical protein EDD18DRAFT_1120294 [Armillaria luteobubalina]|uniref:Uncharacterized protein n=1 Tax=Armillaria luteobubalina TaxID=153913 RepID=A0AA39UVX9_9AGAR|nr:hypothetical protein EDD18DRAFT_1120294 [Armillaria luteobubalina]
MDPSPPPPPPLPKIHGDNNIILDVYSHSSVQPAGGVWDREYGNPERLAELGKRTLDLVVTAHFFHVNSDLSAGDIRERKEETLSDDVILRWIDAYHLKNQIRAPPDTALDDPNELRTFFHTFIGALYIRNGIHEIQNWISRLIDPNHDPASTPSPPQQQQQQTQGMPTQPSQPPLPVPSFNPSSPPPVAQTALSISSLITLQLIHQTAAQKGFVVTYNAVSQGPAHAPTWTAQCLLNGQVVGTGQAGSQKLAKEAAAKEVWNAYGWGPQA